MTERQRDVLVVDFDGTITTLDLGDAICEQFADPAWRDVDLLWERRELPIHEAQLRMWAMVDATPREITDHVLRIAAVRDGFDELLRFVREASMGLVLASGGFDLYISAVLGSRLEAFDAFYCNRAVPRGRTVDVSFPFLGDLGCGLCAVCKGKVCDRLRAAGHRVTFIGDGTSDRCAIGRADRMFAVRGSKLARGCAEAGVPVIEVDSFHDVLVQLREAS